MNTLSHKYTTSGKGLEGSLHMAMPRPVDIQAARRRQDRLRTRKPQTSWFVEWQMEEAVLFAEVRRILRKYADHLLKCPPVLLSLPQRRRHAAWITLGHPSQERPEGA